MSVQYWIYLLIFIGAAVSTALFSYSAKNKDFVRTSLFFAYCYYFAFSVIKVFLGNPELTLIQSFWDANTKTYFHYGLPLLVIAIISPLLLYTVFKEKAELLIKWDVSISIVVYSFMLLIVGKMPNMLYDTLFVLIFLTSVVLCLLRIQLAFDSRSNIVHNVKSYWMIALFPVFLSLFYFPNELYLTNIREFYNPYYEFVFVLVGATFIFTVILLFFICLLPVRWIKPTVAFTFGVGLCSYLQYLFFNGTLDVMLGKHQEWEPVKFILNGMIWLAVIIIIVFFSIKSSKASGVLKWGSLFIITMLSVTVITLLIQNSSSLGRKDGVLTHNGDLVLAPSDNVLVFVLDTYDYRMFMEVLESTPAFAEPLHDFILYEDAIARHSYTDFSIPFLLTGSTWHEDEGKIFQNYAYEGNTLLSNIYSIGADIGIYTDMMHFDESQGDRVRNYRDDVVRETDIENTVSIMAKTSLYKMMPFAIKENYFYDTSDMSWMVKYGEVWTDYNDVPFYERIMNERLSIDNSLSSTFRFYHMRGVHYPFYLSEDVKYDRTRTKATSMSQAKGSMNVVYAYLEQLKELGLYDDTTIIITADHGNIINCDTDNKVMLDVSRPILFVKKRGQKGDLLKYNHAEVSHVELISTILDAYGLDYSWYGPRLEDIEESETRERYFGYYTDLEGVVTGKVIGDGEKVSNWVVNQ